MSMMAEAMLAAARVSAAAARCARPRAPTSKWSMTHAKRTRFFAGQGSPRASELMKAFGVKMIVEIFALHGIYVACNGYSHVTFASADLCK